jgi:hypothetical protein
MTELAESLCGLYAQCQASTGAPRPGKQAARTVRAGGAMRMEIPVPVRVFETAGAAVHNSPKARY